ncbi:hypothetical protein ACJ3XI_06935 [Litorimonas sp. RW-G-Af-16]|uniref:hypothetical protein n=1 Tax=Litorimonas sp. RW-G-Af-16 TaxID=3241168 RepID=UPI00390C7959
MTRRDGSPRLLKRSKAKVEPPLRGAQPSTPNPSEKGLCYEIIERDRWEDEGGADPDVFGRRNRGVGGRVVAMKDFIQTAQSRFDSDDIEGAIDALTAAADHLKLENDVLHASVNDAIAHLTTLGCTATPPHPKALSLVRLRRSLLT